MNPQGGNKMAKMPIKSLLLNMGAPMMISMLGQALYNVVDTFFVSHIPDTAQIADMGDKAINALTLAFPIQSRTLRNLTDNLYQCRTSQLSVFDYFFLLDYLSFLCYTYVINRTVTAHILSVNFSCYPLDVLLFLLYSTWKISPSISRHNFCFFALFFRLFY